MLETNGRKTSSLRDHENIPFTFYEPSGSTKTVCAESANFAEAIFSKNPLEKLEIGKIIFEIKGVVFKADWPSVEAVQISSISKHKLKYTSEPISARCNRNAHRYSNILIKYTDENGNIQSAIAEDVSMNSAKFTEKPWNDVKKIRDLTFNINGMDLKAPTIEEHKHNKDEYVIKYKSAPINASINSTFPNAITQIETLYTHLLKDIQRDKNAIPPNKTRIGVLILMCGIIIFAISCPIIFAVKFKVVDNIHLYGVFVGAAVVLSGILCVYALKSQKDLQEYAKNDRRLVVVNYLEQVMIAFSFLKSNNEEKAIDKLQKAGEFVLETIFR